MSCAEFSVIPGRIDVLAATVVKVGLLAVRSMIQSTKSASRRSAPDSVKTGLYVTPLARVGGLSIPAASSSRDDRILASGPSDK